MASNTHRVVTFMQVPMCPSISLSRALLTMRDNEELCDLTFISDNHKKIQVHKNVFYAMSGYIQNVVKQKMPNSSFILTGISAKAIKDLVDYVYGNVYAVHCQNAEEIYPIAKQLDIKLLCATCEYVNPKVMDIDWKNKGKIVPVRPDLLGRKPFTTMQGKRKAENSSTESESSAEQSEEDNQVTKKKKIEPKSPNVQMANKKLKKALGQKQLLFVKLDMKKSPGKMPDIAKGKKGQAGKKSPLKKSPLKKSPVKKTGKNKLSAEIEELRKSLIKKGVSIQLDQVDVAKENAKLKSAPSTPSKSGSAETEETAMSISEDATNIPEEKSISVEDSDEENDKSESKPSPKKRGRKPKQQSKEESNSGDEDGSDVEKKETATESSQKKRGRPKKSQDKEESESSSEGVSKSSKEKEKATEDSDEEKDEKETKTPPKKRGRKPKQQPKEESNSENDDALEVEKKESSPKKRGRPKKSQSKEDESANEAKQQPDEESNSEDEDVSEAEKQESSSKKRGRPKKSLQEKNEEKESVGENVEKPAADSSTKKRGRPAKVSRQKPKEKESDDEGENSSRESETESLAKKRGKPKSRGDDSSSESDEAEKSSPRKKSPVKQQKEIEKSMEKDKSDDEDVEMISSSPEEKKSKKKKPREEPNPDEDSDDDVELISSPSEKEKSVTSEKSPKSSGRQAKQAEETVYECGKCKLIFTNLSTCNAHMAEAHKVSMVSVNENFICSKSGCGFKCSDADTLKSHVVKEHPQVLDKKPKCSVCDAEFDTTEALESHSSTAHKKSNKENRNSVGVNGHDDKSETKHSVGKGTAKLGPKSSKGKPAKTLVIASDDEPLSVETRTVDGQKFKVTHEDKRTVRVEDDSLPEGWSRLLVLRLDQKKYDFYMCSPTGKKLRTKNELLNYLDKKQIEMETDHLSFSVAQCMIDAGLTLPGGTSNAGKSPRVPGKSPKTNLPKITSKFPKIKPGPKSSKKSKAESDDDEEEEDSKSDKHGGGDSKMNGNKHDEKMDTDDDVKSDESEDEKMDQDSSDNDSDAEKEKEKSASPENVHTLQADVHAF